MQLQRRRAARPFEAVAPHPARGAGASRRAVAPRSGVQCGADELLALHRSIGNRGVARLVRSGPEGRASSSTIQPIRVRSPRRQAARAAVAGATGPMYLQRVGDPNKLGRNKYAASSPSGKKVAEMRTDGSLAGSPPGAASNDPPGYNYIRYLGYTSTWVRFHLINEEAGGPGKPWNLVPASGSDNQQYENAIEKDLKTAVNSARGANQSVMGPGSNEVYFGVELTFNNAAKNAKSPRDLEYHNFPVKLTAHLGTTSGSGWTTKAKPYNFTHNSPPLDTQVAIDVSQSSSIPTAAALIKKAKIADSKWADDVATMLHNSSNAVKGLNGQNVEYIEARLGTWDINNFATLSDNVLAGGLESLAGLIAYNRIYA